jgi:hypothetical protein
MVRGGPMAAPAVQSCEEMLKEMERNGVAGIADLRASYQQATGAFLTGYESQIRKTHKLYKARTHGGVAAVEYDYNSYNRADILFADRSVGEVKHTSSWANAWFPFAQEMESYAESPRSLHIYDESNGFPPEIMEMVRHYQSHAKHTWTINGMAVRGISRSQAPTDFKSPLVWLESTLNEEEMAMDAYQP